MHNERTVTVMPFDQELTLHVLLIVSFLLGQNIPTCRVRGSAAASSDFGIAKALSGCCADNILGILHQGIGPDTVYSRM